jgi:hypothetical protein
MHYLHQSFSQETMDSLSTILKQQGLYLSRAGWASNEFRAEALRVGQGSGGADRRDGEEGGSGVQYGT